MAGLYHTIKIKCQSARCGVNIVVRLFHFILNTGVLFSLIYKKTALHDAIWDGQVWYYLGFFSLFLFSLVMYYTTCLIDPGYVTLKSKKKAWECNSDEEESAFGEESKMIEPDSDVIKLRNCGFCGVQQPLRARHCELCNRCVQKFDHHCPWLDTCIGERNHKFFWMFVTSTMILTGWGITMVWPCFTFNLEWIEWLKVNFVYLADLCILAFAGFVVTILFFCHTYLMLTNLTTWELVSRERITYLKFLDMELNPFHEGYIRNTYHFLCSMTAREWDNLYNKNASLDGDSAV